MKVVIGNDGKFLGAIAGNVILARQDSQSWNEFCQMLAGIAFTHCERETEHPAAKTLIEADNKRIADLHKPG